MDEPAERIGMEEMENKRIYYWNVESLSNWWYLIFTAIGLIFVGLGISSWLKRNHIALALFIACIGIAILVTVFLVWLAVAKYVFRRYVQVSDNGLVLKQHPLRKERSIIWSDVAKIDLSHFEPKIYIKWKKPVVTVMQFEQNVKFRHALRGIAPKKNISIVDEY